MTERFVIFVPSLPHLTIHQETLLYIFFCLFLNLPKAFSLSLSPLRPNKIPHRPFFSSLLHAITCPFRKYFHFFPFFPNILPFFALFLKIACIPLLSRIGPVPYFWRDSMVIYRYDLQKNCFLFHKGTLKSK